MKKIISILAVTAVASAMSISAFAETVSPLEDKNIDVKAKYSGNITDPAVYSVDIEWGAMEFVYTESGSNVWDAASHEYVFDSEAAWSATGNTVKITNHSNRAVNVALKYESLADYSGITGSMSIENAQLEAGKEGDYEGADSITSTLDLSGSVNSDITDFVKVGTVTVTLND